MKKMNNEQIAINNYQEKGKREEVIGKNVIARNCSKLRPLFTFHFSLFSLLIVFAYCSLLIISCDPFTGPKVDLFQEISNEVDWANAPKLTVTVAYPPEWGNSSQSGEGKCGDTRKGYEFGVDFTPLSGYGFEKWLAFKTANYAGLDKDMNASEAESFALNNREVTITESVSDTGAKTARVTINITEPVTLVPWCSNRPRLAQQTNPPLNPILTPFPYDQTVNIWFTMPVKTSTLNWDNIRITGIYASGNDRGLPFNGNGDLTAYFNLEIPANSNNRLNLVPIPETSAGLVLLTISVTVGPGIESTDGVYMTAAETITYQTNTREAQKVYRAIDVSASHSLTGGYWTDTDYSNPGKDRRFKQNDRNTVFIRFSVDAPTGDDIPPTPNKIRIVERRAYDMRGFNSGGSYEKEYDYPGNGVTLSLGAFTIEYALQTGNLDGLSGIIQLLALPFYDGTSAIAAMQENEAVSEGRYVTIVMDNAAPDVTDLQPSLSAPSSMNGATYVYGQNTPMTLTLAGLAGIADNGGEGGIPASRAYSLPWTMEEPQKLSWYAQIGSDAQAAALGVNALNSGWQSVYKDNGITLNNTWELANLSKLTEGEPYPIMVKFKDSLGNVSAWNINSLNVEYSTAAIQTVANIRAEYTAASRITVNWDETGADWTAAAGTYPYPEVIITTYRASAAGDIEETTTAVTRNRNVKSYSFNAPGITYTGVRNGNAVSGVYGYKISIVTHNAAGDATAGPIWIYNIPGMVTQGSGTGTDSNTVRITDSMSSGQLAMSNGKNFVLTQDILLSGWTPAGTSASQFQGKFYGNGHTVTINSMTSAADSGLFGSANNALIRDLTVQLNISGVSGVSRFGGVCGNVTGTTQIINTIVKGTASITGGSSGISAGGLAGSLAVNASIGNCHSNINLTITNNSGNIYFGGIAGESAGTVNNCVAAGNLVMSANSSSGEYDFGGILGRMSNGNLADSEFTGSVKLPTYSVSGETFLGGAVGKIDGISGVVTVKNIFAYGDITFKNSGLGALRLGGICGYSNGNSNSINVNFDNSEYSNGIIRIENGTSATPGEYRIGGFIGDIGAYIKTNNCRSRALGIKVFQGGTLRVGGFTGFTQNNGTVETCSSTSPVEIDVTTGNSLYIGGFIGVAQGKDNGSGSDITNVTNCFASGSVTVIINGGSGNLENYIGGFTGGGRSGLGGASRVYFRNCYALGNVSVSHSSRTVNVGGFAGNFENGVVFIDKCFAAGTVSAQSSSGVGIRAGGLLGYTWNSNATVVTNSAALVSSVTVKTTNGLKSIRRVIGENGSGTPGSNNYALDTMRLERSNTPSTLSFPFWDGTGTAPSAYYTIPSSTIDTDNDGANASASTFRNQSFWQTTLGFSGADWNFSGVSSRGYPLLAWE